MKVQCLLKVLSCLVKGGRRTGHDLWTLNGVLLGSRGSERIGCRNRREPRRIGVGRPRTVNQQGGK